MESNREGESGQKRGWYKSRLGFIVFVSLIILLVAVVLLVNSIYFQKPAASSLVDFTCHLRNNDEAFNITVNVNLKDGMSLDEAVLVANMVFDNTLGQEGQPHLLDSADVDEHGVWTVELTWGYSTADLMHWFEAEINPFNRTVIYSHCK